MNILVDENIPMMTVRELREQGSEVTDIRGAGDQGITDGTLWQKAQKGKCLLITTDKGFSRYREELHHGLLIIRLKQPTRLKIHQSILRTLKRYSENEWPGLMVINRDRVQSKWKSHRL